MAGLVGYLRRTSPALDVEVVWPYAAEADLGKIRAFSAQENVFAADAVAAAIKAAADNLGRFPFKGHPGEDGTREWVVPRFKRFLLIYDVDETAGTVTILRVWHQSRHR